MADLKHGKINLTSLSSTSVFEHKGKRGIFIPIEENHLFENYKHQVYLSFVTFVDDKIRPYSHRIFNSVPEAFRRVRDWKIGGMKLD